MRLYIIFLFLPTLLTFFACNGAADSTFTLKEGIYELGISYQRGAKQYQEKYLYKVSKNGNQLSFEDSKLMNNESVDHPTIDPPMTGLIKEDSIYLVQVQTKKNWEEKYRKPFPLSLYFPLKLISDNHAQFNWQPPSSFWDTLGEEKHFSKVSLSLLSEEKVKEECEEIYEKTVTSKGSARIKELILKMCLTEYFPQVRNCILTSTNLKDCDKYQRIYKANPLTDESMSKSQDELIVIEHLNEAIRQLRDVELTEYKNSGTFFSCEQSECARYADKLQENELLEAHLVNGTLIIRAKSTSRDVSVSHVIESFHKNSYKNPAAKDPAYDRELQHPLRKALWDVFQKVGASPEQPRWNGTYVHCTKNNVRLKTSSHHSEVDSCSARYGLTLEPQNYMKVHANGGGLSLRGTAKNAVVPSYTIELFLGDLPSNYKTVARTIQHDPSMWFDDSQVRSTVFSLNVPPDERIVIDDYKRVKEREMIVTGRIISDLHLGGQTIQLQFSKHIASVETLSIEPITGDTKYKFRFKLKIFAR